MASKRRAEYDEDLLIELIAEGDMSYRQIAEKTGICWSMVSRIARGERRQELQDRIAAAVEGHRARARRLGVRLLASLVDKHIRDGVEGDGETARKCREYAMNQFLNPPEDAGEDADGQNPPAVGLTAEDYEAITRLKGGPAGNAQAPQ